MTILEMKERKRDLGYTNKMIAEKSGVPLSTVQKVFSGATTAPRRATLEAIGRTLFPKISYDGPHFPYDIDIHETVSVVRETMPAYSFGKQGPYTLADYLALPDDQRVELIDGVFYDMAAPTWVHQAIGGYIHKQLLDFVLAHKSSCYPFISPIDVQLDKDEKTVVQPDVVVLCDSSKLNEGAKRLIGAPDLVIEVLSPSTFLKDQHLKLNKYKNAGVREYWMIDPKEKKLIQYDLEHERTPDVYTFTEKVPVLIWGGKAKIDLKEMYESVAFLYEK